MPSCATIASRPERLRMKLTWLLFCVLVLFTAGCQVDQTPLWQWKLESRSYADPVIDQNNVYIVSQSGEVIAGEFQTGKILWKQKVDGAILAAPALSTTSLFTATESGKIYALDRQTGNPIWKRQLKDNFLAPLSLTSELVLVPSGKGILYAVSPATGETKWERPGNTKYNTPAVIHNEHILIGGWANSFYCLRLDGTINWTFKTGGIIAEEATTLKNSVFFSARDNYVYSLDVQTGRLLWRFPASQATRTVLVDGKIVFVDDLGILYVVQPENGNLIQKIHAKKQISQIYSFSNQCILVSGNIFHVDLEHGKIESMYRLPQPLFKLARSNDMLIATDQLYTVFGIRLQTGG